MVGADWDVMFEQSCWLGAPIQSFLELQFLWLQAAVDLAGTNGEQLLFHVRTERKALANPRHPQRQERLQAHGPGIPCGCPDLRQDGNDLRAVQIATRAMSPLGFGIGQRAIEFTNGIFAMIATHLAKLVQDRRLECFGRLAITPVDGFETAPVPFGSSAHRVTLLQR